MTSLTIFANFLYHRNYVKGRFDLYRRESLCLGYGRSLVRYTVGSFLRLNKIGNLDAVLSDARY